MSSDCHQIIIPSRSNDHRLETRLYTLPNVTKAGYDRLSENQAMPPVTFIEVYKANPKPRA